MPSYPAGRRARRRAALGLVPLMLVVLAAGGCIAYPQGAYWPSYVAAPGPAPDQPGPHLDALLRPSEARAEWQQARISARWSDHQLADSARAMDPAVGRWVWGDAAQAVRWFYVDDVSYREMAVAGLTSLRSALENPAFLERFPASNPLEARRRYARALDILAVKAAASDPWTPEGACTWLDAALEQNRSLLGLPDGAVISEFIFGLMDSLDRYSRFQTPEMMRETEEELSGRYVGVGLGIAWADGRAVVVQVFEDGPGAEAGLKAGDEIVAIDGVGVGEIGPDQIHERIRGKAGTEVSLSVLRSGRRFDVRLERRAIYVPAVRDTQILDPRQHVGYVRLTSFTSAAPRELAKALEKLRDDGAERLVLDLRGNPGGELLAAIDVAGLFLKSGRVARTRGRALMASWRYDVPWAARQRWAGPMAVLVDSTTASAAEILAAALQSRGRATVVGTDTFGKGSAQIDVPTAFGEGGVCLTVARVYDPDDELIEGRGVVPDVEVAWPGSVPPSLEADPFVRAAVEQLTRP